MKKNFFIIFGFLTLSNSVFASVIEVNVSGFIDSAYGFNYDSNSGIATNIISDDLKTGDRFSYRFTFNEVTTNESDGYGNYYNAINEFSGTAGNFSFSGFGGVASPFSAEPYHSFATHHYDEGYSSSVPADHITNTSGLIAGSNFRYIGFLKYDNNGLAIGNANFDLSNDKISPLIDSSDYYNNYIVLQFFNLNSDPNSPYMFKDHYYAFGKLDNISVTDLGSTQVPVPAAVWLFASAIGSLAGFRKVKTK